MYIRFVSNRNSLKRNYIKLFAIVLATIIVILVINRLVCKFTDSDSLVDYIGDYIDEMLERKVLSLYQKTAKGEYGILSYIEHENEESDGRKILDRIVDVIGEENHLYAYINDVDRKIDLQYFDPSYRIEGLCKGDLEKENNRESEKETVIADNTNNTSGDDKTSDNSGGDNSNETDKKVVASTDSMSEYKKPTVSDKGITYSKEELANFDFLMSKLYTVPERAKVLESELKADEMLSKDMTLKNDNNNPQILIYHTHSQEGFADSVKGDPSTTIVGVGDYLAKILSKVYGYNVIHCTESFDMKSGKLDRSKAYSYAETAVAQILEDNPTIEVVLDLHRDGVGENVKKLVTNINGKDTAKIMFFNGVSRSSKTGDIDYLYNRYKKDNLAFSFQLKLTAMECFPEFTRKNYIDAYQYNLHFRPKSVLVEAGAQTNTLQEELNAMEVLAEILSRVLK